MHHYKNEKYMQSIFLMPESIKYGFIRFEFSHQHHFYLLSQAETVPLFFCKDKLQSKLCNGFGIDSIE